MNKLFNYERLVGVVAKNPPFRGTQDKFHWGSKRSHNTKYFFVRKEKGETVFDIAYGTYLHNEIISKEEYDELRKSTKKKNRTSVYGQGNSTVYRKYRESPNIIGRVRADNTFEFTKTAYSYGERLMLGSHYDYFTCDSHRGGMIHSKYNSWHSAVMRLPIYVGMRVNCDTMIPTKELKIYVLNVDRSKTQELRSRYKNFFKVSETMLKAMDYGTFISTAKEIVTENYPEFPIQTHILWGKKQFGAKAEELVHDRPFDAAVFYMIECNVGQIKHAICYGDISRSRDPYNLFIGVKKKIMETIYRNNPTVFKEVEYTMNGVYPSSTWGIKLRVDGKEVVQCL